MKAKGRLSLAFLGQLCYIYEINLLFLLLLYRPESGFVENDTLKVMIYLFIQFFFARMVMVLCCCLGAIFHSF